MPTLDPAPSTRLRRPPRRRRRATAVVSALLAFAALAVTGAVTSAFADDRPAGRSGEHRGASAPAVAPQPRPTLQGDGTCPFATSGFDRELRCGRVNVVENRATAKGRISLFVTIARQATAPTAPPLLLLAGGPGQGGIASFAGLLRSDKGRQRHPHEPPATSRRARRRRPRRRRTAGRPARHGRRRPGPS